MWAMMQKFLIFFTLSCFYGFLGRPRAYKGALESNCKYTLFDGFRNIGRPEIEIKIKMVPIEFQYYFFCK